MAGVDIRTHKHSRFAMEATHEEAARDRQLTYCTYSSAQNSYTEWFCHQLIKIDGRLVFLVEIHSCVFGAIYLHVEVLCAPDSNQYVSIYCHMQKNWFFLTFSFFLDLLSIVEYR